MKRSRNRVRLQHLGVLLVVSLIIAAGVSSVFAGDGSGHEDSLDWLGQDAPVYPEVSGDSVSVDSSRGQSTSLDTRAPLDRSPDDDRSAGFLQVFHPDERERVTPTTSFPASAVAQIEMYQSGSRVGTCTGAFVGPDAVLTAGHCLYLQDSGWADAIAVVPGKDGTTEPFGYQMASNAWVPQGWIDSHSAFWDWGVLRLGDSSMGNDVGWLEIGVLQSDSLNATNFHPVISGYPGDKDPGTQWIGTEPSFTNVTATHLYYRIDTYSGQSGAAIWRGNDSVVVGIHMGYTSGTNIGTRIDQQLLNDIKSACAEMNCNLSYFVESDQPDPDPTATPVPTSTPTPDPTATPQPTQTPTATPSPEPTATPSPVPDEPPDPPGNPGDAEEFGSQHYQHTWQRTDGPVSNGDATRTWMWGPAPFTQAITERYVDSPGGERTVQYFDKSRMEITDPSADSDALWFVTNGLLARELITGERQIGDSTFRSFNSADVPVAGDTEDPASPTYTSFSQVVDENPYQNGETISLMIDRDGQVTNAPTTAIHDVQVSEFVPQTGQFVAAPFWEFMNSSGIISENGSLTSGNLFQNPYYATGFPITAPYWTTVSIAGEPRAVLVQVFERRVLTYAPDNPEGWRVEAGNVGIHYFLWRYVMEPDPNH